MGYTTDFIGSFAFDKPLAKEDKEFLTKLSNSRRMARDTDPKYGVEGEFYVDGGYDGFTGEDGVIDHNRQPSTQPGLWCQWVPSDDGKFLEWDGGEKFYAYVEWLQYIINSVLPRLSQPYVLNGEVTWYGEDHDDTGKIIVTDNNVEIKEGKVVYE
jgi:hypothetical protein